MDYKYINQLLERYWECQTTLEEEAILRAFFSQDDIPASMLKYRDLFVYEQKEQQETVLGEDFDEKILARIDEQPVVKARRIAFTQRLYPIFKSAAIVAIILTLGNAINQSFSNQSVITTGSLDDYTSTGIQNASVKDTIRIDSIKSNQIYGMVESVR